ncbi:MAG: DegT/DnrJ/EryC1/StrS family aminotransferase [Desulfovibrio sp.]|nr:DegT/DnrJ/EryC1/StrS family aminotransferase [Desulfovibrio sp.]MBI4960146.1 DegT/DnrJ/EryC1/StrS family aminotransferase [Desulfovibrio sp.]
MSHGLNPCRLAVVVPVYGNEPTLRTLHQRILDATRDFPAELTIQYVNDRSPDNSQAVLEELAAGDSRVRVLLLSRNHGSFVAITAGINEVRDHDATCIIAADLQDPPEIIPELISKWREGAKVVLGVRRTRDDPFLSQLFSRAFNWLFRKAVMSQMPVGGFDLCLIDRQVVEVLLQSSEKQSSLVGLILWSGFERAVVSFDRAKRPVGRSMWTFTRKLDYAVNSIVSFSALPLKGLLVTGAALMAASLAYILVVLCAWAFGGVEQQGWTSLMCVQLVMLSTSMGGLGVIGAYLWNTLEQVRKRPLFIVDKRLGGHAPQTFDTGRVALFDSVAISAPVRGSLAESAGRVLDSNALILGPEVERFETVFAAQLGLTHAVGVANGTDALTLALWAAGLGDGDVVAVPAISAPATAVAVLRAGCRPWFLDVNPDTLTLDPQGLKQAAPPGLKAVIPVHLYGNPCDMKFILALSREMGLMVIEDCAQSSGSFFEGKPCGSLGHFSAFSFYPTKNLGGFGDGGVVATADEDVARRIRRMRFYGQDDFGECVDLGINSRLDEMQAALLSEKLKILVGQNQQRKEIARRYDEALGALQPVPTLPGRAPHLYVVRVADRERFRSHMAAAGIDTGVHYPLALHRHSYLAARSLTRPCPNAEAATSQVTSLPCYPGLGRQAQDRVIEACLDWVRQS